MCMLRRAVWCWLNVECRRLQFSADCWGRVCLDDKNIHRVGRKQSSKNFNKVGESLFLTQNKVDVKLSYSKGELWAEAMWKSALRDKEESQRERALLG